MTFPARLLSISALATGLLLAACIAVSAPMAASSGRIAFDLQCYVVGEHPSVNVAGSGFVPGASMLVQLKKWVKRDQKVVQSFPVTADATGTFSLSFPNPGEERIVTVGEATDPEADLATKTLKAGRFEAGYFDGMNRPGPTRVKDTMVMFGQGFAGGQQGARGSGETGNLYLHRVAPGGSAKTELLSSLQPCGFGGTNRVTGRALFKGSAPVKPGKWKFQYDTKSKYKSRTKQKIVLRLKVSKSGIVKPGEQTKAGKP